MGFSRSFYWLREGVGVEPTAAGSAPPAADFEDRGAHRDTSLPIAIVPARLVCTKLSRRLPVPRLQVCAFAADPLQFAASSCLFMLLAGPVGVSSLGAVLPHLVVALVSRFRQHLERIVL